MIYTVRKIKTFNPVSQNWKYLRGFLDESTTVKQIKHIQNITDDKLDKNIRKQAKQISYCIKQAEEYFQAASNISSATKPLLLYYGSVSLSQALVLLTNDGTYSFDYLREKSTEKHHGLELKNFKLPKNIENKGINELLSLISCNIYTRSKTPIGFFKNFYKSLVPTSISIPHKTTHHGKNMHQAHSGAQPCADVQPIDEIKDTTFNCYNLSSCLSDCYTTLKELGERPKICRGSIKTDNAIYYKKINGKEEPDKLIETFTAIIDDINQNEKEKLLSFLNSKKCPLKETTSLSNSMILKHVVQTKNGEDRKPFYHPDMVDDLNGDIYYIIDPTLYIHESASLFIILYCLGMLSRYYPDIWMKMINENVIFYEFIDSLMQIAEKKFPNLILDQMTRVKHQYVH